MMASCYTRSKAPRPSELAPSECSDVEPSDVAPVAATSSSSPSSIIVRPSVAAAGGPESMSTELAGPVSAPNASSPSEKPSLLGQTRCVGACGSSLSGGLCLGVPQRSGRPV